VGEDGLRLRFFSPNRESALRYVQRLVQGTRTTVATLVATARDRIVAVATAERMGRHRARHVHDAADGVQARAQTLNA
jgi:hypothetical protein